MLINPQPQAFIESPLKCPVDFHGEKKNRPPTFFGLVDFEEIGLNSPKKPVGLHKQKDRGTSGAAVGFPKSIGIPFLVG